MKETTSILLDKDKILLGLCVEDKYYKDSIKITNIGDRELFITDILTSCDCTEIQWSGTSVPSGESKIIYIIFKPDGKGEFERYVTIDCNVNESL